MTNEGRLVDESMKDPAEEAERMASDAGAGVDQQYAIGRENRSREMAAMGINPNSGRWEASAQGSLDSQAASKSDAMNKGRTAGMQLSWAKRMDASNLGRNLPSNQATSAGLAIQAGNSAVNNASAGGINARADAGQMNQGYDSYVNTQFGLSKNAAASAKVQQESDDAMWGAVGQGVGMYAAYASSKKIKTNKQPINEAEMLAEIKALPVEKWDYKKGEGDGGEHIGPYAEDVNSKFGNKAAPGGKAIDVVSMMGINIAATKALAKQVDKIERKIRSAE